MSAAPGRPAIRHIVEQPTLRRVVEHLTLVTLVLAVSLYAIGQFQSWRYIQSFGIPTTGIERGWETYVFTGAVTVINLVMNPGWSSLRWVLPISLFLGTWLSLKRMPAEDPTPRQRILRTVLGLLAGIAYVFMLLMLGVAWGIQSANLVKDEPASTVRYVVTPEAQAVLPAAFTEANAKGSLRFVATGSDSLFLYDPERKATYALPIRLIVCRVYEPLR